VPRRIVAETTSPASQFSLIDLSNGDPLTRKAGGSIDIPSATAGGSPLPDPIAMNMPPAM
jgi:hypothetical protein